MSISKGEVRLIKDPVLQEQVMQELIEIKKRFGRASLGYLTLQKLKATGHVAKGEEYGFWVKSEHEKLFLLFMEHWLGTKKFQYRRHDENQMSVKLQEGDKCLVG